MNREGVLIEEDWTADMWLRVHRDYKDFGEMRIFPALDIQRQPPLDAILIPGGGLEIDGNLPPWVKARLDTAWNLESLTRYFVTLSRGTVYKHPVIIDHQPLDESTEMARYLVEKGASPQKIITENSSRDTLGSAYFTRVAITDPMGLRELLVITSGAIMLRTLPVSDWVFHLPPENGYHLHYLVTPNIGFNKAELEARVSKEVESIIHFSGLRGEIKTLAELANYIFFKHDAYRFGGKPKPLPNGALGTY